MRSKIGKRGLRILERWFAESPEQLHVDVDEAFARHFRYGQDSLYEKYCSTFKDRRVDGFVELVVKLGLTEQLVSFIDELDACLRSVAPRPQFEDDEFGPTVQIASFLDQCPDVTERGTSPGEGRHLLARRLTAATSVILGLPDLSISAFVYRAWDAWESISRGPRFDQVDHAVLTPFNSRTLSFCRQRFGRDVWNAVKDAYAACGTFDFPDLPWSRIEQLDQQLRVDRIEANGSSCYYNPVAERLTSFISAMLPDNFLFHVQIPETMFCRAFPEMPNAGEFACGAGHPHHGNLEWPSLFRFTLENFRRNSKDRIRSIKENTFGQLAAWKRNGRSLCKIDKCNIQFVAICLSMAVSLGNLPA